MNKIEASSIKMLLRISCRIFLKTFCQFSFGALSVFSLSLSYSWTLRVSWSILTLDQERKESKKKEEASKEEQESSNYSRIIGMYQFACVFSLLYMACMVLDVALFYLGMGFSMCDSVFSLAFPFSDIHGVVEFSCFGLVGLPDGFEAE